MFLIKKHIFFVLLLLTFLQANAQRIQNFGVFVAGSAVGVKFTISTGPQCSGYKIYHSLDSNFVNTVIYDYSGVCGASANPETVSYTHVNPTINQVNFYKVELIPFETSPIKRVFVPIDNTKIKLFVYPNPIVQTYDVLNLKIANSATKRLVGFIYNQFGKPLRELDVTTQFDLAALNVYDLTNGLYVLWLTDGTQAYSSKFIINR